MYVEFYEPTIFLIIALVGCTFIIHLTFYLQSKNIIKWLTILGRNSLYIYVSHVIVFASIRIMLVKLFYVENIFIILLSGIFAGLTVPLLIYKLAVRFNMRFIFTLEKSTPKKTNIKAASNTMSTNQIVKY